MALVYHLGPLIFQQCSPGLFSRERGSVQRQREKKWPGPLKHSRVRQVHHHLAWIPLVKARHKLTPDLRGGETGVNLLMGGTEKSQFNQHGQRQRWRNGTDFAINLWYSHRRGMYSRNIGLHVIFLSTENDELSKWNCKSDPLPYFHLRR